MRWIALMAVVAGGVQAADFQVATNGSDAASGAGPFATLPRALAAARALRAADTNRATPVVIQIHGGTHFLASPVVLGPEDSGTAAAPLIIEGGPGETAIVSGGTPVTGWRVTEGGRWQAVVPGATNGGRPFAQFYVGDQRRFRPTLPRDGYFTAASGCDATGGTAFVAREGDADPAWAATPGAEALLFHSWSMSRLPVESVDTASRTVTLRGRTWQPEGLSRISGTTRYRVENVAAAFGAPGDWLLEPATGTLTYAPMPGERPESVRAVAPRLGELVRLEGDRTTGRRVEHVAIRGLTFAHTSWTTPRDGYSFCQAEAVVPAALTATSARGVVIEDCVVRHTGGYAVEFGAGCEDCRIEQCELVDLGAGGVKIGGQSAAQVAVRCAVRDCRIEGGGRVHPAAVGVWVGFGAETAVERNEIADFYYTAVSVGWVWNASPTVCRDNRVVGNHLHHLGQGVLCDMGGIYTLGRQPGSVLGGNRIHDVSRAWGGYGGWGLYFDEGSCGFLETGNLAYLTEDAPFHAHACSGNVVRANIFAFGTNALMQFSNLQRLGVLTVENNVFAGNPAKLFASEPDEEIVFRSNLYWRVGSTAAVTFAKGAGLEAWRAREPGAEVADPGFADAAGGDFRLRDGARAAAFGVAGFDPASAGRLTKGTRLAGLPPVPRAYPPALPPPPYRLHEDFEHRAVGKGWTEWDQAAANAEEDARVTDECAAGGRRSLCLRDGPGGATYMPHLYHAFSMTSGVLRAGLDARVEPGVTLEFEVREHVGRYHEGPWVQLRPDGTVFAGGKELLKAPTNAWVRLDFAVGVGARRTGVYRVEVRLPGEAEARVFDGLRLADTFRTAGWIGIASHGHERARCFVDNVTVENAVR